jgi:hypothetical protein
MQYHAHCPTISSIHLTKTGQFFLFVTNPILKCSEREIAIADETIPKTSTNPKQPGIQIEKKAERRFGKNSTSDNLGSYRIFSAFGEH